MTGRYVALGSSMAAGPGITPHVNGAPFLAFRSARNYPHLLAEFLGLDLVDVTYAGATTADVLAEKQNGTPPQVTVLNGSESLVTVTIGDNDVGYVPLLTAAYLPHPIRSMPIIGGRLRDLRDLYARNRALAKVAEALIEVGHTLRQLAPDARIIFVDYLTLLPPPGVDAPPLSGSDADLGRHVAETLERHTAEAAAATGCESSERVRRAVVTTPGHQIHGQRKALCRCLVARFHFTPTLPGCAPSPNSWWRRSASRRR